MSATGGHPAQSPRKLVPAAAESPHILQRDAIGRLLEGMEMKMEPTYVVTIEPLAVRRRVAGEMELDFLPAGSRCELAGEDDVQGTFILVDDQGDEVWAVHPFQFAIEV